MKNLYKIFFGSKQPKKLWNTSTIPFLRFPMNFKLVTLKKELSDLSKKCMKPDIQKILKKCQFSEKKFLLERIENAIEYLSLII